MTIRSLSSICFKCNKRKKLTSFYVHSEMNNGHLGKCKSCTKKDVGQYRHGKGRERVLAYDRKRAKTPHRLAMSSRIHQEWKKENPGGRKAQMKVLYALRSGKLIKPDECSSCHKITRIEAHHPDYRKALLIKWLCNLCHKLEHGRVKNGLYSPAT